VTAEDHPAWSAPFERDAIRTLEPILPVEAITREWAWEGSTGTGVKVAVIDSGVDASHPAVGHVEGWAAFSEVSKEIVIDTAPHEDLFGHGTACAGIIRSIAPDCELYSVRVLGKALLGRGAVLIAGLRWAIDNGMHVCNLSLTTTKKEFYGVLHELADRAYFQRIFLVTSANNMPVRSFPALFSSVLSVASHDTDDPYLFYYNPEPPVEFGAHGVGVRVPWVGGGWITTTGNSFATPHISGIVARILAKHPELTTFEMKAVLRAIAANTSREARRKEGIDVA
jgi:subtilisin family serine protease